MLQIACAVVLATSPARVLVMPDESAARMAIGLDVAMDPRAFLASRAGVFGLQPEDELVPLSDGPMVAVFERRRGGIAVMDGEVKVTLAPNGHIVMVHVGPAPPPSRGNFWVDDAHAEQSAAHGLDGVALLESRRFWMNGRPVYRVRLQQAAPYDVLSALVDAQTGALLERRSERMSALMGSVYDFNPCKPAGGSCGTGMTCAPVVTRALGGLSSGATQLQGSRVIARNCQGAGIGTGCLPRATANASGDFVETPSFDTSTTDRFGEVMAYYEADRYSAWTRSLSSTFGGLGLLDVFTNVGGSEQGFFLASGPFGRFGIELGQGMTSDWASRSKSRM